jgi:hypothetical protein
LREPETPKDIYEIYPPVSVNIGFRYS